MHIQQRIDALSKLSAKIKLLDPEEKEDLFLNIANQNPWFTAPNIEFALHQWASLFEAASLESWIQPYLETSSFTELNKKIGVVMAGNIPLVGLHDWLTVLIGGNILLAKLSHQDTILIQKLSAWLIEIEPLFAEKIFFVERLNDADAFIATGSNNSARYFEYYFSKKPHLIRKNRNAVAVLNGTESEEQLGGLSEDIFRYFGLGCRNVSKLYVPQGYEFDTFFQSMEQKWKHIIHHHKYFNNYEYRKAIYLVEQIHFFDNGFALLVEDTGIASPISVVHYEYYESKIHLEAMLKSQLSQIQCILTSMKLSLATLPLGSAQEPKLSDYADGVDTLEFLLNL